MHMADPETEARAPNKVSRQVRSGHYVAVAPTKLPNPSLVIYSKEMAAEIGLSDVREQRGPPPLRPPMRCRWATSLLVLGTWALEHTRWRM